MAATQDQQSSGNDGLTPKFTAATGRHRIPRDVKDAATYVVSVVRTSRVTRETEQGRRQPAPDVTNS